MAGLNQSIGKYINVEVIKSGVITDWNDESYNVVEGEIYELDDKGCIEDPDLEEGDMDTFTISGNKLDDVTMSEYVFNEYFLIKD